MIDEVTLTNDDDESIIFSKLPDHEKRKFKNIKISYTETRDWSESQCQEFFYDSNHYDILMFTGQRRPRHHSLNQEQSRHWN